MRFGLILEDDAIFDATLPSVIQEAIGWSEHWHMLRLSSVNTDRTMPILPLAGNRYLGITLYRSKGAAAYVLTRRAAEPFVCKLLPMKLAYDLAFDQEYLYGLKAVVVTPYPVRQDRELKTQIQVNINRHKLPFSRYMPVFPYRVGGETRRVIRRFAHAAQLRQLARVECSPKLIYES